jgi:DNA-binding MarR family transcriptional regulator
MEPHNVSDYTGYLIRRAQQAHVAAWQREVSTEVTSVQFGVLSILAGSPGASQQHLVERLDLDRSTIADIVARLERRGLLERVRDGADKRRNVLHLTAVGETEFAALVPRVARVDEVLTRGLAELDRGTLRRLLTELLNSSSVQQLRD